MAVAQKDLAKSLSKLSLNQETQQTLSPVGSSKKNNKKSSKAIADSWEDEEDSDNDSGEETDRPLSPQTSTDYPSAPPPTPISPTHTNNTLSTFKSTGQTFEHPYGYNPDADVGSGGSSRRADGSIRPDKTDAVAKRMIAGALGVRAPKKTEEQRAYERAVKEKEIRRREEEKAARVREVEEAEKAKAAVWSD